MRTKIYLLALLSLMTCANLQAQEAAVSKPLKFRIAYADYLRSYVEAQATAWTKYDRFEESPVQYQSRTSEENMIRKYAEWKAEADSIYKRRYAATVRWNQFRLAGNYDSENETALVARSSSGPLPFTFPGARTRAVSLTASHPLKLRSRTLSFWEAIR